MAGARAMPAMPREPMAMNQTSITGPKMPPMNEVPLRWTTNSKAHRAIDHARRRHPIPAQAGYEGKGFPVSLRYAANQSLAARAPAAQPVHFRIGRGLVDEHQSGGIKHGLPSLPASTCPGHVRAILLRVAQAFSLS